MSREELTRLAGSLLAFHRALMDAQMQRYEAEHGPVGGPLQRYALLTDNPAFGWLRPLSGLMARIDEAIDDRENPPGEQVAQHYRGQVAALLAGEASSEFRAGYGEFAELDAVQRGAARVREELNRGLSA